MRSKYLPSRLTLLTTALTLAGIGSQAAELTDMAGRQVQVPDTVDHIFAAAPPVVPLVYAIDPSKLVTLNFPFKPRDSAYVSPAVKGLPIIGRYTGEGRVPNPEVLAKAAPQVSIAWDMPFIDAKSVEQTFTQLGTPGLFVHLEHLADYPPALELVGRLVGQEQRAAELGAYIRTAMNRVQAATGQIPPAERKRVYFAEGPQGLLTECNDSFHAEVIALAGGENVMQCETAAMCGREKATFDQIKALDPDVILAEDPRFFVALKTDPAWSELRAVRHDQILLVPTTPFNWMGRPPSFMRAIAIQWLVNRLYPERFPWNAQAEIKSFYALFLGLKPEAVDVSAILGPPQQ